MAEGKAVRLVDIIENPKYRLFQANEEIEVTPTAIFKAHKVPKNRQFSFIIKPMGYKSKKRAEAAIESNTNSNSFFTALQKAGLKLSDIYTGDEAKIESINMDNYRKVVSMMEVDLEKEEQFAEEVIRVVKENTLYVAFADEREPFEPIAERFNGDIIAYLFDEIIRESTLTSEERLSL